MKPSSPRENEHEAVSLDRSSRSPLSPSEQHRSLRIRKKRTRCANSARSSPAFSQERRSLGSARSKGRVASKNPRKSVLIRAFHHQECREYCMNSVQFGRRHPYLVAAAVTLLVFIQIAYNPFSWRKVDHFLSFRVMALYFPKLDQELKALGVILPRTNIDYANVINTHAALRSLLVRREKRALALRNLEASAQLCDQHDECQHSVPGSVFVPMVFEWDYPRRNLLQAHNYTTLLFEESEMRQQIEDTSRFLHPGEIAQPLVELFDQFPKYEDKVSLWSICAIFFYGGIFVGNNCFEGSKLREGGRDFIGNFLFRRNQLLEGQFSRPVAAFIVGGDQRQIYLLAATPRHPMLGCILMDIEGDTQRMLDNGFAHLFIRNSNEKSHIPEISNTVGVWQRFSFPNGGCSINSCSDAATFQTAEFSAYDFATLPPACSLFVLLLEVEDQISFQERRASVAIKLKEQIEHPRQEKITLQSQLREKSAEPGWFCNRCLNWAARGSFESCKLLCPPRYKEILCDSNDIVEKINIPVDVIVEQSPSTVSNIIPRIIHQTWYEEITLDRYPQLARLQASWKNSGWEYRFYTDDAVRRYIHENYPSQFLDALDALIHGAYKADLFRYLVLLKEGGVYADVDVLLQGNLDAFIRPAMSFFAPRDVPCEYAGEPFCLFNGFMGSSAGNPILVHAVERLVNLIQARADIYDMEREACRHTGEGMDVWKVRAQPLLFLSGPCALGVAFNEAMNRSVLDTVPLGWHGLDHIAVRVGVPDLGDALILVGDKYDLGEFR